MSSGLIRALRFARAWGSGGPRVQEEEREIHRKEETLPATLFHPRFRRRPYPGWIVLHGITRPGRKHPTLVRFARALAGSGAAVLIPEIPEWRELNLAPEAVADTILVSARELDRLPMVDRSPRAVIGFSFGAPQAVVASTHPALEGEVAAVVGFGGYCDLERTARFLFVGEHEWEGKTYHQDPDPYGRWILGGNYLTRTPGGEDSADVADALFALARKAGDAQVGSWEARFDGMKASLEAEIHPTRRSVFRAFAPPSGEIPSGQEVVTLASALAGAMREVNPLAEPSPYLAEVKVPVRLVHGREDRMIPFTETLRLQRRFPAHADIRVHLTGLFAHSYPDGARGWIENIREKVVFLRMLTDILSLV